MFTRNRLNAKCKRSQLLGAGIAVSALVASLASSAQAASFTTNFTANNVKGGSQERGDIWLNSVLFEDGQLVKDFVFVNDAKIVSNDLWTKGNEGAASADIGHDATTGIKKEKVGEAEIITNLANNNLNNIIDTEDKGNFAINLSFSEAIDNILLWERGMNSKIGIQALNATGDLIGNFLELSSKNWNYAGFDISTKEINNSTQKVGSIAVTLADLGLTGPISSIRVTSLGSAYNGPDWKVVGTKASVPEPGAVVGLVTLGLLGAVAKRKRQPKNT
jgi:hypothetical protein